MNYSALKSYLRTLDKNSLIKILEDVGLSEDKQYIIIQCYSCDKHLNIICGELNLSQQTTYRYHGEALRKLNKFLNKN